eukprot:3264106-Amphidinium_carterae.1
MNMYDKRKANSKHGKLRCLCWVRQGHRVEWRAYHLDSPPQGIRAPQNMAHAVHVRKLCVEHVKMLDLRHPSLRLLWSSYSMLSQQQ